VIKRHFQVFFIVHIENCQYFYFRFICPNDLEHASHVTLCSGIIFTKFELDQPIRFSLITFLLLITLRHAVTLIPLALNICSVLLSDRTLCQIRAKFNNPRLRWVIDDWNFIRRFQTLINEPIVIRKEATELYQIWRRHRHIIANKKLNTKYSWCSCVT